MKLYIFIFRLLGGSKDEQCITASTTFSGVHVHVQCTFIFHECNVFQQLFSYCSFFCYYYYSHTQYSYLTYMYICYCLSVPLKKIIPKRGIWFLYIILILIIASLIVLITKSLFVSYRHPSLITFSDITRWVMTRRLLRTRAARRPPRDPNQCARSARLKCTTKR